MTEPIRVLLVDDHAHFRQVLRADLGTYPNIKVVGEAEDGKAAVLNARNLQPAAIVMDINMSAMDGITATHLIKKENPDIAVVGLSLYPKDYEIYAMVKAGAFKVLDKGGEISQLYGTLQQAVAAIRPIHILHAHKVSTTILLIDGNHDDRRYYAQRLKSYSSEYVVLEAKDGRSALDLYKSQHIDCIVTEHELPDMSVFTLLLEITPPASVPKVPVIMLCRLLLPDTARLAKENGAQACLIKQFTSGDELEKAVLKAIAVLGASRKSTRTQSNFL